MRLPFETMLEPGAMLLQTRTLSVNEGEFLFTGVRLALGTRFDIVSGYVSIGITSAVVWGGIGCRHASEIL